MTSMKKIKDQKEDDKTRNQPMSVLQTQMDLPFEASIATAAPQSAKIGVPVSGGQKPCSMLTASPTSPSVLTALPGQSQVGPNGPSVHTAIPKGASIIPGQPGSSVMTGLPTTTTVKPTTSPVLTAVGGPLTVPPVVAVPGQTGPSVLTAIPKGASVSTGLPSNPSVVTALPGQSTVSPSVLTAVVGTTTTPTPGVPVAPGQPGCTVMPGMIPAPPAEVVHPQGGVGLTLHTTVPDQSGSTMSVCPTQCFAPTAVPGQSQSVMTAVPGQSSSVATAMPGSSTITVLSGQHSQVMLTALPAPSVATARGSPSTMTAIPGHSSTTMTAIPGESSVLTAIPATSVKGSSTLTAVSAPSVATARGSPSTMTAIPGHSSTTMTAIPGESSVLTAIPATSVKASSTLTAVSASNVSGGVKPMSALTALPSPLVFKPSHTIATSPTTSGKPVPGLAGTPAIIPTGVKSSSVLTAVGSPSNKSLIYEDVGGPGVSTGEKSQVDTTVYANPAPPCVSSMMTAAGGKVKVEKDVDMKTIGRSTFSDASKIAALSNGMSSKKTKDVSMITLGMNPPADLDQYVMAGGFSLMGVSPPKAHDEAKDNQEYTMFMSQATPLANQKSPRASSPSVGPK